jgi:hypothetical protein
MTVLNPLSRVDERIMDDADLAGPITILFCFGIALLFVRTFRIISSEIFVLIQLGREIKLWVHLWCWLVRRRLSLHPPQPHVGESHRRLQSYLCTRILSHTYGRCWYYWCCHNSRVRFSTFQIINAHSHLI